MLMMRQHIYGTPNYAVVSAPDYSAPALPADLDYAAALGRAASLGRTAVPGGELRLVELRTADGNVAAHTQMNDQQLIFDLGTGEPLASRYLPPPEPSRDFQSTRSDFKFYHRFNYLGQWATGLNGLAGIAFAILIVTGLVHYVRLYKLRAAKGRSSPFWSAGDGWRNFHRWIAVVACLPILWLTLSGFALSVDNFGAFVGGAIRFIQQSGQQSGPPRGPNGFDGDLSSPMSDAELPAMTRTTLAAFREAMPNTPIRVLRLRYFSGYPQGVVVAGDRDTTQLVFNATTGARMSMTEPGYPGVGFPVGWEWHQKLKQIHRGDIFGMPGRWLDTFGALAMVYLVLSGALMYWQLWSRRKRAGRPELTWK
jgi:uncharacterized iron-regulated membrane protein